MLITSARVKKLRFIESILKKLLLFCAVISIFTSVGIIFSLSMNSFNFFKHVSVFEFLTGTEWSPLFHDAKFGVLPLIAGTLIVSVGAAFISIPLGLLSAIYLSEYAHPKARKIIKPLLEVLAGIPSIVYGFFALTFITPILQKIMPATNIYNAASASIAIGIMTVPLVSSLSEDAMSAVPDTMRHGAYALGATKIEVVKGIVIPAALSGIAASFILALSRAIGETMIVALAAGARPSFTFNPLESVQTLTAFIAQASMGDNPFGTVSYYSLYAVAFLLFLLTLAMNIISQWIVKMHREARR